LSGLLTIGWYTRRCGPSSNGLWNLRLVEKMPQGVDFYRFWKGLRGASERLLKVAERRAQERKTFVKTSDSGREPEV
jgi:hypothetical protein